MEKFIYFRVAAIFLLGLCTGSFLNVVIYRLPRGESIAVDRSRCPSCGKQLSWFELIPVISYLLQFGKCRTCHSRISLQYPVVELLTGAVFAVLFLNFGATLTLVKYLFLCSLLIAISLIDLRYYIIPNSLVITGLVGGVLLNIAARDVGALSAIIGILATSGFLLLIALLSKGGMGGGDIKLAAVTGLFLGWPLAPFGLFLGAGAGGLLAIFLLLFKLRGRKDPLPFGPFISLGSFFAILYGFDIINWYLNYLWSI